MDFWHKARNLAQEAAKRSQDLTIGSTKLSDIVSETARRSKEIAAEASKRSQELAIGNAKLADIVSETAKRSKEIAAEASKRADQIRTEAVKRAGQIKSLSGAMTGTELTVDDGAQEKELERYGVTEDLREFVKDITINTFQDFPLADDAEMCDVAAVSNVRQDLTEWQAKHASLVLSTVKEISKLRYELCPRVMKERKFWRIYFILVNSHVVHYEKRYIEDTNHKSEEQVLDDKEKELSKVGITSKPEENKSNQQSEKSTPSSTEQDLDVFLLGGESDEEPDDGGGDLDDDFDQMDSSADEKEKL